MGRKEIDVIDFSHTSHKGGDNAALDVPDFVDSAHTNGDYGKHAHRTDFVLPYISEDEEDIYDNSSRRDAVQSGYGRRNKKAVRQEKQAQRTEYSRRRGKKRHRFRWDRLVLIILILFVAFCARSIYNDFHEDDFDAKEAVAPQYEEGVQQSDANGESEAASQAAGTVYKADNKIVCIDAGHGGSDPGAEYKKNYEKTQTLEIAKLVKKELENDGYTVIMTREDDSTLTLDERVKIAENANAGILVSIHRNFYQDSSKDGASQASGVECWISNTKPSDAEKLSNMILVELNKLSLSKNRGVKYGTINSQNRNYRINTSKCTSCIIELGFITNSKDDALVTTKKTECAKAIADGIKGYLKSL